MYIYRSTIIILSLLLITAFSQAKNKSSDVDEVIEMIKLYMQEDEKADLEIYEDLDERLLELNQNPINLNTATREELNALFFLSDLQIENLLFYVYSVKEMKTIYELQLIEELPSHITRFLLPFVTIIPKTNKTDWKHEIKHIKNNLSLSAAYKHPHETSDIYGSIPIKSQLRYKLLIGKTISAGITADHDAGEQFFGPSAQGFSHYKAYAEIKPAGLALKSATIGSFRASFGQGLLIGNMGYGSPLEELSKSSAQSRGTHHYGGTDEFNYFSGLAANFQFGQWKLSSFYSYRLHDADISDSTFSSIDESGYHTSHSALNKRNTLPMHTAAVHASFSAKRLNIGLTTIVNHHSIKKINPTEPYYINKFNGNTQFGASLNYRWHLKNISFYGEWAVNQYGAPAFINTVNISPSYSTSIIINHRYYSPKYDMYYSKPYSSTSNGNNEHGGTIGLTHRIKSYWQISSYVDIYKYIWISYTSQRPSINGSLRFDAKYNDWDKIFAHIWAKYKYYDESSLSTKTKTTSPKSLISIKGTFRYRLQNLTFTSGLMANYNISEHSYGYALVQEASYTLLKKKLTLSAMFSIFSAQDWSNRLYWYEKNLPYSGYSPALYGKGARWYILCKGKPTEYLSIYLRIAQSILIEKHQTTPHTDIALLLSFRL